MWLLVQFLICYLQLPLIVCINGSKVFSGFQSHYVSKAQVLCPFPHNQVLISQFMITLQATNNIAYRNFVLRNESHKLKVMCEGTKKTC